MKMFQHEGRIVSVNDTERDILSGPDGVTGDVLETALAELVGLSPAERRRIDNTFTAAQEAKTIARHAALADLVVAEHREGRVLLSPLVFTTGGAECVSNRVAARMLETSPLGRSLHRDLGAVGLYGFISALETSSAASSYRCALTRVMASLSMATSGADTVGDLPPDAYLAWLSFHRTSAGTRWREDLWSTGRDVAYRCLRELTFAYARFTGHESVTRRLPQKRSDAKSLYFWADIVNGTPAHIRPWLDLFEAWRSERPAFAKVYRQTFMHLVKWLDEHFPEAVVADVASFMTAQNRTPSFSEHLAAWVRRADASPGWEAFITHHAQAHRFSEFIARDLGGKIDGRAVRHLVTEAEIAAAKSLALREGAARRSRNEQEVKSRPLPMTLYKLTQEILGEGEKGWPGTSGVCMESIVRPDGSRETVYCPVLPTLFASLFEVPLRVGQMKRLDSGEGDQRRFDGHALSWGENGGCHAGHWHRQLLGEGRRSEEHGYARRVGGLGREITGIAVNTDKGGVPYVVPWENKELHRMLHELRLWQEAHNPIPGPIGPELYVDDIETADRGKLKDYPDIFPLFRMPPSARTARRAVPPSARLTNEFWQRLMAEVEERWNAAHEPDEHIEIVKRQKKTGQPYGAKYNPHGLRVAGLTLMLEQGVPIEVLSKLVAGHKTILMTLHYIRFDPAVVNDVLDKAAQERGAVMAEAFVRDLKVASFEVAQRRAAALDERAVRTAVAMDSAGKMLWTDVGLGICVWEGARCHDGGPILRKDKRPGGAEYNVHAPVEGGARNCVLCRHFITGQAWNTQLWLFGTRLSRQFAGKAARIDALQRELDVLRDPQRTEAVAGAGARRLREKEIETRVSEQNALSEDQIVIAKAMWNTQRLLEACAAIKRAEGPASDDSALVAQQREAVVEYLEVGSFEQAAILTAASRIYPILHDSETEAARDAFLDAVMWHSGGTPLTFAPLTPDDKRRGQDAFATLLLERATREERVALESGALRLQDIGIDGDVAVAVSTAVGKALSLPSASVALSGRAKDS